LEGSKVELQQVREWLNRLEPAKTKLIAELGEGENSESSADCLLLAVPFMTQSPNTVDEIDEAVNCFVAMVEQMNPDTLRVLATYGRRWQVVIETVIPVGVACSIKMSEQRLWHGIVRSTMVQEVSYGDAMSTHIEIRMASQGVVIRKPRIVDFSDREIGYFDEIRDTPHAAAIYASDTRRPEYAQIRVSPRPSFSYQILVLLLSYALIALTAVTALSLETNQYFVDSLTLLVLPITLFGGFVMSRESTSLADRLLFPLRTLLASGIVILWIIAIVRLGRYVPV